MNCKNCGSYELIKAHLIPRAFCVEIQTGKSHAAAATQNGGFEVKQSGVWDREILCGDCDGKLGVFEQYAHRVAQDIRQHGSGVSWKANLLVGTENLRILRFCAGILYKYSLTTRANGRIELGRYKDVLREFIFNLDSNVPSELDVIVMRPLRYSDDRDVFAYRAPVMDYQSGVNLYRMMMGGLIFFVHLDKRTVTEERVQKMLIKNCTEGLPFMTVDAANFEEFTMPREMIQSNERLSAYLDKNPSS